MVEREKVTRSLVMEKTIALLEPANLTFIVTDACNYDCVYCPQKKENLYMNAPLIEKALDFFYPFLKKDRCFITFYGGEPLLAFDQIKHTVLYIGGKNKNHEKDIHFSMTTNGSLLDDDCIEFLNQHQFSLMLSFDGLAHEIGRQTQSFDAMVEIIKDMRHYPGIELSTNSVFTPETVEYLSLSIQSIIKLGIKEPKLTLSTVNEWTDVDLLKLNDQLNDMRDFLVAHYRETGAIPLSDFRPKEKDKKSMFGCAGAKDRLAITPEGKLWGCFLFSDFFKDKTGTLEYQKYFLGRLEDFIENYQAILEKQVPNYQSLYQGSFYTDESFCFACEEVEECKTCPVNAALSGSILLGKIPLWICKINKLMKTVRGEFLKHIQITSEGSA
ncbi:MAG: uncharacterized protein QG657_540 [Acidobacteriota bacterium]|nr:uncharacterized protein [Acidobacteriota bacterium]